MTEQVPSKDVSMALLREWHLADERFDLEDWSRRVRNLVEDAPQFFRNEDGDIDFGPVTLQSGSAEPAGEAAAAAGAESTAALSRSSAHEPSERHPMLSVLAICTAYESGYGLGLVERPKGNYSNPYDPVNSPHEARAWAHGYDEGIKRRAAQPPVPEHPDKARLDWLNEQPVHFIELDDFSIIDVRGLDVRAAIDTKRSAPTKESGR